MGPLSPGEPRGSGEGPREPAEALDLGDASASRTPDGAAREDSRLMARVWVAAPSVAQVALVGVRQPIEMELLAIQRSDIELRGSRFLPRDCQLEIELPGEIGASTPRLEGVVRKVHMAGVEPRYGIGVRLKRSHAELLKGIRIGADLTHTGIVRRGVGAAFGTGAVERWAGALVTQGVLTERELHQIAATAKAQGVSLEVALASAGVALKETVYSSKAMDLGVPFVTLLDYDIQPANAALVPEDLARRHGVFPLFHTGDVITLGMSDPADLAVIDQVRLRARCHVDPCLCSPTALESLISQSYRSEHEDPTALDAPIRPVAFETTPSDSKSASGIVRLVHSLVGQSARDGASDIHIEPEQDHMRVRIRVDGILHEKSKHPLAQHSAVVSRIKVKAKLDIAETRRPQDGQFNMEFEGISVDVRVSTIPTIYGENVVLRLLIADEENISLEQLGMPARVLETVRTCLDNPNGMILVTGPTGSGKTSTLYAALKRLNSVQRNIVTVEDPVEKRVALLRQTQVNARAGVTFASGLRSILRQDPDIIMVGEIRDAETAEIAVQAALTGHLVLSTLHTNTASDAVVRLSEMGIAPFLITSSLRAVISQRLMRRVCVRCVREVEPDPRLMASMGLQDSAHGTFKAGEGCRHCLNTGYKGRIGIFEILEITPSLSEALQGQATRSQIEEVANRALGLGLREDGLSKVRAGLSTLEELVRIVGPGRLPGGGVAA